MFKPHTDDELKELAIGIHAGSIFTDRHLHDQSALPMVFMPLVLGALKDKSVDDIKSIGLIYERIDAAGPRSINGYPCFTSMRLLDKPDTKRVFEMIQKLKDVKL